MHVPLERLHAEDANQLRIFDYVVLLPDASDERRAWQAWVRLTKVYQLKKVAVLLG